MRKVKYSRVIISLVTSSFFHTAASSSTMFTEVDKRCSASNIYYPITLAIKYMLAFRNVESPMVLEVCWWGTMAFEDGGFYDAFDSGYDACKACVANKQDPATGCRKAVENTVRLVMMNVLKITIGWNPKVMVNGANDETSPAPIERSLEVYPCSTVGALIVVTLHILFLICIHGLANYTMGQTCAW